MGQYYKMLNIDKRETLEFSSSKFWDVLSRDDPTRLIRMLAIPRKLEPYGPVSVNKRGLSTDTRDLGAPDLPYDVLHHIFSKIYSKDIKDAVYLALTNSLLRDLGQKRVNEELVSGEYHAPWYSERLILVGENVDGDDLPADMLLEDEKEELAGNAIVDDDPFVLASTMQTDSTMTTGDCRFSGAPSFTSTTPGLSSAEREEMELLVEEDSIGTEILRPSGFCTTGQLPNMETWDDATDKVINEVMDIWRHVLPRRILDKLPASKHTVK
ncbi:uncharacterized protein B0H18DRAFT_1208988 [Fomitopsis serialis]|uniref:uncharacterized protein n=1 Tax=Fomitopsis serialis TaxID=139415 RepID=UPI0020073433|nr:uncharacterized protein B0H18DRAFT_1208988 [Neoantrodia serialis]KAH9931313.1 hypothetical protein B0H18DRAFT_1208988 [Neoantrodia serialis]